MKSISKLKDQARAHEQKENWQAAIEAYQKVLNALDETETELDLSLYNRIGDLYYRVGQPDRAVHYYSQAAQKYAEMGLFNNAIALCNKALRYRPDDIRLFRMLGEFSAEQGFLVDARRWYLQFAERQVHAGKVEEAFEALEEFAALADDPSVRETLADQFLAHDRTTEALQQLERAYKERVARGESAEASALLDRIRELDPEADVDALAQDRLVAPPEASEPATEAEDTSLVIETSAGSAGFHGTGRESDQGAAIEKPSGLETRPEQSTPTAGMDGTVSGLEVGFGQQSAPSAPEAGDALAGMETFDTAPDVDDGAAAIEDETAASDIAEEDAADIEDESVAADIEDESAAADIEDETAADVEPDRSFAAEPVEDVAAEDEEVAGPAFEVDGESDVELEPEEDFADDEEPEPLPLLDLGQAEPEADEFGDLPGSGETGVAPTEEAFGAGEAVAEALQPEAAESDEDGAGVVPAGMAAESKPGEDVEEAEALPLLDLGDEVLLDDLDSGAVGEEADVAAFDLGAFDLTLANAAEATDAAADVDAQAVLARARELVGRELHDQALSELRLLLVPRLDRQVYEDALRVVNEMVRRDPDDFPALQRRVEFASHLDDKQVLAETYADLGACMMRKGAETKAATVYRRVLELDPANEAAREVLGVAAADADSYVDLAAFLDDEGLAALASGEANAQLEDFAELFSQFKAKVTEDVAVEESGSHYDLGLAFKEMGLIDEAIAEFQTALRGGEERLKVYEELGQCFMLKEQYTVAVKILARALELPRENPHELLGVYYHLGMCHEELGDRNAARQAYDNIMVIDPTFSDVPERLSRL